MTAVKPTCIIQLGFIIIQYEVIRLMFLNNFFFGRKVKSQVGKVAGIAPLIIRSNLVTLPLISTELFKSMTQAICL